MANTTTSLRKGSAGLAALCWGCALVLLPGCSALRGHSSGPGVEDATTTIAPTHTPQALPPESTIMYDIMVAELAGQQGDMSTATASYLKAARLSDDPAVAERALRVALFAKDSRAAVEAAHRWVDLAPDELQAHEALAALSLRSGDTDEAIRQLDRVVTAAAPDTGEAYEGVTGLLAGEPDRQRALKVMAALASRHPKDPNARLAYARLAWHADKPSVALKQADAALALKPHWPEAQILKAEVQGDMGNPAEGARSLAAAVRRHPKNTDLRLAYARLLVQAGELKTARRQFEVLARQAPDNADVQYSLGLLALEAKRYGAAAGYFRRLLELGERVDQAHYYLGRIAEERRHPTQAIRWYRGVGDGDYWLDAQVRIADLQAAQGHLTEARRHLRNLRLQRPRLAVRLYVAEGELLSRMGHNQEAEQLYTQALARHSNDPDLLYARALVAEKLDKLEQAEHDLKQVIKQEPHNAVALNALGYTLADRTDRYAEALVYIRKALVLKPDDPAVIDSMGWVQYKLGNHDEALRYLRKAYDSSGDAEIGAHLGEVLWMSGQHGEARKVWTKARREHPDNAMLKRVIKRFTR